MGVSISHGVPSTRSALTIANLGKHLSHALTASEWREVAHLFDGRLYLPIATPPAQALRIATLLTKAVTSRAMDPQWGELAALLATSARRAHSANQNWEWT